MADKPKVVTYVAREKVPRVLDFFQTLSAFFNISFEVNDTCEGTEEGIKKLEAVDRFLAATNMDRTLAEALANDADGSVLDGLQYMVNTLHELRTILEMRTKMQEDLKRMTHFGPKTVQ